MAVLTDAQVTKRTAKPTYLVRIDGKIVTPSNANSTSGMPGIESWETEISFDAPIAVARIVCNILPEWVDRGMSVTIDAGYDGINERVFTGFVLARGEEDPEFTRNRARVIGAETPTGTLVSTATVLGGQNLIKPPPPTNTYIEIEQNNPLADTQAKVDELALRKLARYNRVPRRPAGDMNRRTIHCVSQLYKASRTIEMTARSLDLLTGTAALGNILDYVGITNRVIGSEFAGFTLGSNSTAQLERMPALQMIAYILELFGSTTSPTAEGHCFDSDDGVTTIRVMDDLVPSASAFRTLSTETQAQAFIIDNTSELVTNCDPRIKLGMTLGLVMPRLSLNGRFVVVGRKISFSRQGFLNTLDMRGGDELGGSVALNPIASFAYSVTREVIGDRVYAIVSFTDQSFDPDGSISTRVWSDNAVTVPEISTFTGKSGQVRIDGSSTGYQITLTVTDSDGLTAAVTQSIDLGATTQDNVQPALFCADDVGAAASPDGGQTWNDQASAGCRSVAPKAGDGTNSGIAVWGFTDGSIKRNTDFCRSALTTVKAAAGADGIFNAMWWDTNEPTRVWGVTSTGRLYRSDDDGATWATSYYGGAAGIYKDFGGTYPLSGIATPLPPVEGGVGGVWVFGGRGDNTATFAQFDAQLNGNWQSLPMGGELATAAVGASSSITVGGAAASAGGFLLLAFKGAAFPAGHQSLYGTNDPFGDGSAWKEATGVAAGSEWRWLAPSRTPSIFYGQVANSRDIYKITCTSGTPVVTLLGAVLPNLAGITANDGIWEGGFIASNDVYLISVEDTAKTEGIVKWVAEETSAGLLRPATGYTALPANALVKRTMIGAPAKGTTLAGRVAATTKSASPRTITKLYDNAVWDALKTVTGVTDNNPRPYWVKPNVCMVTNGSGTPSYSKDGGATFAALAAALAGAIQFVRDGNGVRVWCLIDTGSIQTKIYYSDDDGDTWNLAKDTGANTRQPVKMACHPTEAGRFIVIGKTNTNAGWAYFHSGSDPTSGYVDNTGGTRPCIGQADPGGQFGLKMLHTGRIVAAGFLGAVGSTAIYAMTCDDNGVTWTTKYTDTGVSPTAYILGLGASIAGKVVTMRHDTNPTPDVDQPVVSLDLGQTWTAITPANGTLQTFTGNATIVSAGAVYDPEDDALYVATNDANFAVVKLSPVSAAGSWVNVKDAIGSTTFGFGNLTGIPRA